MNVLSPTTLREACELLAANPAALPMAGATDLLAHWPVNQPAHDRAYLDLSPLSELRRITWSADSLTLGALTTYWDVLNDERAVAELPLLAAAARQVGAIQIQSRGTWAGNIANASPAADGVPALLAYDANVTLTSAAGSRTVPLDGYFTAYRRTVRRPDELITAVTIPLRPRDFAVFHKVGPRKAQAITKVGLAIARLGVPSPGRWRVVANSVAPTVKRCRAVEHLLETSATIRAPEDFLPAVNTDVSPIDDIRSTGEYRRLVMCNLLYHSLKGVAPGVV